MSAQGYRGALLGLNFALVAAIGLLGYRTAVGASVPPSELPPKGFDATTYAVNPDPTTTNRGAEFRVITQELDRAEPPPAARQTRPVAAPVEAPKTPTQIKDTYSLVWVSFVPEQPRKSSIILQHKGKGEQFTVAQDDEIDGFKVVEIQIRDEPNDRIAVVTLEGGGKRETIELRRQP